MKFRKSEVSSVQTSPLSLYSRFRVVEMAVCVCGCVLCAYVVKWPNDRIVVIRGFHSSSLFLRRFRSSVDLFDEHLSMNCPIESNRNEKRRIRRRTTVYPDQTKDVAVGALCTIQSSIPVAFHLQFLPFSLLTNYNSFHLMQYQLSVSPIFFCFYLQFHLSDVRLSYNGADQ